MTEEQGFTLLNKIDDFFNHIKSSEIDVLTDNGIFKILSNASFGELLISILVLVLIVVVVLKWIWEVNANW